MHPRAGVPDPSRRSIEAPGVCHGLADEGFPASRDEVRTGFVLSLAARSMFTALPLETLGAPPSAAQTAYWVERIRLTRFMLGLAPSSGTERVVH
ncbi:MAG TPA: hypothetical protein VIM10_12710 [Actinopolymorphaceae bacterium]